MSRALGSVGDYPLLCVMCLRPLLYPCVGPSAERQPGAVERDGFESRQMMVQPQFPYEIMVFLWRNLFPAQFLGFLHLSKANYNLGFS